MELVPGTYSQLTAVLLESKAVWGEGFSSSDYLKFNLSLRKHPWSKKHFRHLVLLDKVKSIRSSVKVFEQEAVIRGEPFRMAQICELFTPKAQRGRGFAKTTMQMLRKLLAEEGFGFAVSFTPPSGLPAPFGFRNVEKPDLVFDLVIPSEPRRKVADCRHKVPEAAQALYRKQCPPAFHVKREPDYWDMLRFRRVMFNRLQWDRGRETLTMCEDGAAYAWTMWTGEHLEIKDAAFNHPDALADIFAHLFQRHGAGVVKGVRGCFSSGRENPPFLKSIQRGKRSIAVMPLSDSFRFGTRSSSPNQAILQFCSLDWL